MERALDSLSPPTRGCLENDHEGVGQEPAFAYARASAAAALPARVGCRTRSEVEESITQASRKLCQVCSVAPEERDVYS